MCIDELIITYKCKVDSISSEINELSCGFNTHPDDLELCKILKIKLEMYQKFLKDIEKVRKEVI